MDAVRMDAVRMDAVRMDAVRMFGGPYDGAEVDLRVIFGERPPEAFAVGRGDGVAQYERGADEAGSYYQYAGTHRYAGERWL